LVGSVMYASFAHDVRSGNPVSDFIFHDDFPNMAASHFRDCR